MTDFSAVESVFKDLGLSNDALNAFKAINWDLGSTNDKLNDLNDFIKNHLPVDIEGLANKISVLYSRLTASPLLDRRQSV